MPSFSRFAAGLLLLLLLSGCTGEQNASQETEESGLKSLSIVYGRYLSSHRGQPPPNEEEFRKFAGTLDLSSYGAKSVDEMFVSERDNQPYVVIYGPPTGPPKGLGSAPIIAYEKEGVGGKRYVASSRGGVEEVDEARFKELVPSAP